MNRFRQFSVNICNVLSRFESDYSTNLFVNFSYSKNQSKSRMNGTNLTGVLKGDFSSTIVFSSAILL